MYQISRIDATAFFVNNGIKSKVLRAVQLFIFQTFSHYIITHLSICAIIYTPKHIHSRITPN